jgi:hypothetical protein
MCQVACRGAADANSPAIRAFDGDDKTAWLDKSPSSWIQCQYADGRKYLVSSYAVVCNATQRVPRALELSGSNDGGLSWTLLDAQQAPGFTAQTHRREFSIVKPAKWNLYRLTLSAVSGNEGVQIAELELNEAIHCRPGVAVAAVTLDHTALTIPADGRATLNATVAPMDSSERMVTWISRDPTIAEVRRIGEQSAIVVGKKPGVCTVTANLGNAKHNCTLTVTPSTLPAGWSYHELNAPPIPSAVMVTDGKFTLTGCGHAMTSWWERIRDQGVFASGRGRNLRPPDEHGAE